MILGMLCLSFDRYVRMLVDVLELPLALFVTGVAGTDDADRPVAFDDLAEFASAFHRSSYFHSPTCFPKLLLVDWLFSL